MRYAIYCGSSKGSDEIFENATIALGNEIVTRDHCIVYGGATVGLMGAVADCVMAGGQSVIGVMPKALVNKELQHPSLTQLHIVDTMSQRKEKMAQLADAFIAMPGGVGTLEEIFEVWTAGQLGYHHKACAFYNVAGYYDELLAFIKTMVNKGFMNKTFEQALIVSDDPIELLDQIANYKAPRNKWD